MKIAVVAGFYPPDIRGGGEISGKLLVEGLAAAGAEVSVLTCSSEASEMMEAAVRVRRVTSPNVYWSFEQYQPAYKKAAWHLGENFNPRARHVLKRFLREIDPDIVVTNTIQNFGAEAWIAPSELGIPSVHVLRGYYPFCWRSSSVRKGKNCEGRCFDCGLLTFGRRRASQRVSGVVGIGTYVLKRHLAEGLFSTAKTTIIPPSLSADAFASEARESHAARFGYLGVLSADKGLETLVTAWRKVSHRSAKLRIAGRGPAAYAERIRQSFAPDVDFVGWTDSKTFLRTIDFLIVPSIWNEPFGRVVAEALAMGIPVIGSRLGGIAETINDGRDGLLFEAGNADELAGLIETVTEFTQATYREMSATALVSSVAYRSSRVANEHLSFYAEILDGFRGRLRHG